MPTISMFYGILIKMFFDDHAPPHFHAEQYEQYQKSLIQYWDLKNVSDTSFEEGEKVALKSVSPLSVYWSN